VRAGILLHGPHNLFRQPSRLTLPDRRSPSIFSSTRRIRRPAWYAHGTFPGTTRLNT